MARAAIERVAGSGCVLRGDDIDTDRVIPARVMKVTTFDTMGEHAFEGARQVLLSLRKAWVHRLICS